MWRWLSRILVVGWFVGMVFVAVRGMSVQGQADGEEPKQYFPTILRNAPVQVNPPLRDYRAVGTSFIEGNAEIYTVRADGSAPTRLTTNTMREYAPSFSPDGAYIAFNQVELEEPVPQVRLMFMNRDGSGVRPLLTETFEDIRFQWSPTGERILVLGMSRAPYPIYTLLMVVADGSAPATVLAEEVSPAIWGWSPTGAYFHYGHFPSGMMELWVQAVTGSPVQLSDHLYQAAWHPNGRELFVREYAVAYGGDVGRMASPDGSTTREVYRGIYSFEGWLLQGQALLLHNGRNLATVPYSGGVVEPMTTAERVRVGGIAPDGSAVLYFADNANGDRNLYVHPMGMAPRDMGGCNLCSFTSTSWAQDGSGILTVFTHGDRVISSSFRYLALDALAFASEFTIEGGTIWESTWTGTFLPFSSSRGVAQYTGGYPAPQSPVPRIITTTPVETTLLPFPNPQFEYTEWRYLP